MTTTDSGASTGTDTGTEDTQSSDSTSTGTGTTTTTTDATDTAAELAKWKALAQKHEERAKANHSAKLELEKLQAAQMTEQEKAIAEATAKARAEVMAEVGSSLVEAEFKAASAGRDIDLPELLENLDRSKFLTEDGKPDAARIGQFVAKIAPVKRQAATDTGQGARKDGTGPAQITDRAVLQVMTAEQIVAARNEGRLKTLLGG